MSDINDVFARAAVEFEEIRTQYRADRERLLEDDEARQQALVVMLEEHRLKEEERTREQAALSPIDADEELHSDNSGWSSSSQTVEEFSFGFEDSDTTSAVPPKNAAPSSKSELDVTRKENAVEDDDFFDNADWLQK